MITSKITKIVTTLSCQEGHIARLSYSLLYSNHTLANLNVSVPSGNTFPLTEELRRPIMKDNKKHEYEELRQGI